MQNKISSSTIKNNSEPIAICRIVDGVPDLSNIGLLAIHNSSKEKEYQLNCYGLRSFSPTEIKKNNELEEMFYSLISSKFKTKSSDAVLNGRPLRVYFGDKYSGLISFGTTFDNRTVWDYNNREHVVFDHLGIGIGRYSPDVKNEFEELINYLDPSIKSKNRFASRSSRWILKK